MKPIGISSRSHLADYRRHLGFKLCLADPDSLVEANSQARQHHIDFVLH